MPAPSLSVIVPVHNGAAVLPQTLAAIKGSQTGAPWELIVVDDASTDASAAIAGSWADRVVTLRGKPLGPGGARNRGAEQSRGDWLVFIDADVVVHPDTLQCVAAAIEEDPAMDAVFGAYDEDPPYRGFLSRYRNLLHRYIHLTAAGEADTFWAGCGAVRAAAFRAVGGFDAQRYPRPQIEDIELGYRLRDAGYRICIRPEIQGAHLKRWTWLGSIRTDLRDRGIPWVRLLLERRRFAAPAKLNLKAGERVKTILVAAGLGLVLLAAVLRSAWPALAGAVALLGVAASNWRLYAWFRRRCGAAFALGVIPLNLWYYLESAAAVAAGLVLHQLQATTPPQPGLDSQSEEPIP